MAEQKTQQENYTISLIRRVGALREALRNIAENITDNGPAPAVAMKALQADLVSQEDSFRG